MQLTTYVEWRHTAKVRGVHCAGVRTVLRTGPGTGATLLVSGAQPSSLIGWLW